jgi:hypothetical protein
VIRLKRAIGPGSYGVDSQMQQLITDGKEAEAAKLFEDDQARTHRSGAWARLKMRTWYDWQKQLGAAA